jgi:hypothetical protein
MECPSAMPGHDLFGKPQCIWKAPVQFTAAFGKPQCIWKAPFVLTAHGPSAVPGHDLFGKPPEAVQNTTEPKSTSKTPCQSVAVLGVASTHIMQPAAVHLNSVLP